MSHREPVELKPGFPAGCGYLSPGDLEAAIAGRLPAARAQEFEQHLDGGCGECATLAADLEAFAAVVSGGVLETERREADRQAELLGARLRRAARGRQTTWGRRWPSAAAAVLVVGVAAWLGLRDGGPADGLDIVLPGGGSYVAAVKSFSAPPVLRGERNLEELWRSAGSAYERGRYERAQKLLAEILEQQPDSFDARVYRGVCLLALERVGEARAVLAEARTQAAEQELSTTSLAWFEGLAALADGDVRAASAALDEAAAGTGADAERARELIGRLPD